MKFHPDVLAVHAEFGGDSPAMQALYDRPDHLARIAELAAENERLTAQIVKATDPVYLEEKLRQIGITDDMADEALASTGAMKVKALDEDDYEEITNAAGIAMRRASRGIRGQVITVQDSFDWWVMKETERRILSALDIHPRATNTVDAHETANVRDKPEGQQEPVATGQHVAYFDDGQFHWMSGIAPRNCELFTHPSEQAVTEAMLRSAIIAYRDTPEYDHHIALRNALKAAMEAGG